MKIYFSEAKKLFLSVKKLFLTSKFLKNEENYNLIYPNNIYQKA